MEFRVLDTCSTISLSHKTCSYTKDDLVTQHSSCMYSTLSREMIVKLLSKRSFTVVDPDFVHADIVPEEVIAPSDFSGFGMLCYMK